MVDRNTAKAQAAEKAYGSIGSGVGAEIGKLVERVPRFGRLAKAIEGGRPRFPIRNGSSLMISLRKWAKEPEVETVGREDRRATDLMRVASANARS